MGYKIIKGWPSDDALDYPLPVSTPNSIVPGNVFMLGNDGICELGNYASDGSDASKMHFFCVDYDSMTTDIIGLTGNFMAELDSDLYEVGNYTPNLGVTSKNGKISVPVGTERIVAYVVQYFPTTGKLILTWNG